MYERYKVQRVQMLRCCPRSLGELQEGGREEGWDFVKLESWKVWRSKAYSWPLLRLGGGAEVDLAARHLMHLHPLG